MKSIKRSEYHKDMGKLINLTIDEPINDAINISYDNLMYNKEKYLEKNKTTYIYCSKGNKSKQAIRLLEYYGYKVVQVTN